MLSSTNAAAQDEDDDPVMLPDDDEGVTQKLTTQRVPSSLIKHLEKTPSKRRHTAVFADDSKDLNQSSTHIFTQGGSIGSIEQGSEKEKLPVCYRPTLQGQKPGLSTYMKQV